MAALETFIRLSLIAMLIEIAIAASYTLLEDLKAGGIQTQTFKHGHHLKSSQWETNSVSHLHVFQYPPNHNVVEVTKADYDSCQPTKPIQSYSDGATTVPLTSPGKRYFICGAMRHCGQGMKILIETLARETSSIPPTESPSPAVSPVIPIVAPSAESPADFIKDIPAALSPLFDTHSPNFSPVIPSTQQSPDQSNASAKKGNLHAFIAFVFSFLLMLLAS